MGIDEHAFVADMNGNCRTCGHRSLVGHGFTTIAGTGIQPETVKIALATPKGWDERWMAMARMVASWSKDRSTGVGAVVVGAQNRLLSLGYNGLPRGVDDDVDARHERPAKYLWAEHAERNAVYNASRSGVVLENATMYCTLYPCADCARAIIQSGIWDLVTVQPTQELRERWGDSFTIAAEMLEEADVEVRWVE